MKLLKGNKNLFNYGILSLALVGAFAFAANCAKKADGGPGKSVFQNKGCVACHSIDGSGDKPTGPELKGVTKRRTKEWLTKWITNPTEMLKTDEEAKKLLEKFKTPMPPTNLNASEVGQVIAYFEFIDGGGVVSKGEFKPLNDEEFKKASQIFFDKCSGCHGPARNGATGKSLLPNQEVVDGKKKDGGGTKSKGTEALEAILWNGVGGMPAWGKEGILTKAEVNMMARFIQMDPPPIPVLGLEEAKKSWKLIVPVDKRPSKDESEGKFENYMGIVLRDIGQVAIVDAVSKKMITTVKSGFATHILRSSSSGRYFYVIGRDGFLALIDLWMKKPEVVATVKTCHDARSVDSSKAPGYKDKYAIVGCYTPYQYAILDGATLEPISMNNVSDITNWKDGKKLDTVRVAAIVASEEKPFWVLNMKEAGIVSIVDYTNPKAPKRTDIKANNALHDGGWVTLPGSKEKRYFVVAANASNQMCVIDTHDKKLVKPPTGAGPCIEVGKVPHPGRGANLVHPKFGPVYATTYIGDNKLTLIGVDPKGHKEHAWKVVENKDILSEGSLFVKSHPNSKNLWFDMPLSAKEGLNGQVGVYDIPTGNIKYINVSPKRVVHFEYNREGTEVWISGWLENVIYVYDDKTLKLKEKITGDWIKTPTGKFNVYNTTKDIY